MRAPNFNFEISSNEIQKHVSTISTNSNSIEAGLFHCRTANDCIKDAKLQPTPKKLYNDLLIENELTILVADTGVGKSIFAVQIANYVSKTANVLYMDLELSDKQFQGRYSDDYQNDFIFNDNLYRSIFIRRCEIPNGISYEDYFIESLKKLIVEVDAKIVVIDNMTRLITGDTDQARNAKPLMDRLNDLKFDYNLTMLLLEHTKKVDPSRPIHLNDLQGSKMKANFSDAIFTIGRSAKDKNLRYIKQLKTRSAETIYDSENVMLYEITKENSFLKLNFIEYSNEYEHLKQLSENDSKERINDVLEMKSQGKSNIEIAKIFGVTEGSVRKWIKKADKIK
jgi:RecA-family ATPase